MVNLSANPPEVGYVSVVVSETELTLVDYNGNPFDSFINPQMQYLIYSTKPIKEAILAKATTPELKAIAMKEGFRTMQDMGRELILTGDLNFREFDRVLSSE